MNNVNVTRSSAADGEQVDGLQSGDVNARLDRLPMCWPLWVIFGQLSLAFFFEIFDLLMTGYIAPDLVRSGILTTTTEGLFGSTGVASFVAALFAGLSLGTLATGLFADRFGRRRSFLGALAWFAIASAVMAFQQSALGLNAWRFIAGLGLGIEMVTIGAYITELVPKDMRGRAFAFSQAIGFSAVPVVAFLAWYFASHPFAGLDGWRWVVLLGSVGSMAAVLLGFSVPESPLWLAAHGRVVEADRLVRLLEERVERATGRPLEAPQQTSAAHACAARFADIWRPPLRRRTLMLVTFNIFQTVGFYGFVNWAPTMLIARGMSIVGSLMYVSIIALAAPVGPVLGLIFADRFERKHVIMLTAGGVAVLGILFGTTHSAALVVLTGIGITLCQNTLSFSYHAYQAELFPTAVRAKAVGFVYAWSRISAIFNAFIIAYVLRLSGVVGVFTLIAAAMAVVVATIGWFGPRTRGRSLDSIVSCGE
jgi:putative MFS transporter